MLGRRLLVLFAVLLGLTALVTSLAPRPTAPPLGRGAGDALPHRDPIAGAAGDRVATDREDDLGGSRGGPYKVKARVGDILALTVQGDVLDGVEITELGKLEPIEPGSPARFEVLLERRGELRVELVDAERLIGVVEVAGPRA